MQETVRLAELRCCLVRSDGGVGARIRSGRSSWRRLRRVRRFARSRGAGIWSLGRAERASDGCGGDLPRWSSHRIDPGERSATDVPTLEIELGRDIRVRIPATVPKELASAILKALVAR
jgi:hypothetical protein